MTRHRNTFYLMILMTGLFTLLCSSCSSPTNARKVKIITSDDTTKNQEPIPQPRAVFVCKIKEVLIFQLRSDSIDRRGSLGFSSFDVSISGMEQCGVLSSLFDSLSAINVLFVSSSGDSYKLFETDLFISGMETYSLHKNQDSIYPKRYSYSLEKNLYAVADKDTNDDGFLSKDDEQNLYASDYNGKNLKLILNDISGYKVIDDNEVLISRENGETEEFHLYKVTAEELVKLNTKP